MCIFFSNIILIPRGKILLILLFKERLNCFSIWFNYILNILENQFKIFRPYVFIINGAVSKNLISAQYCSFPDASVNLIA